MIDGTNCNPRAVLACRSVNLVFISFSELFNHQCFERNAKICEPLDIEVNKPRICGRQIMMVMTKSKLQMEFNKEVTSASSGLVYVCFGSFVKCAFKKGLSRSLDLD
jgi:hypothetical protein